MWYKTFYKLGARIPSLRRRKAAQEHSGGAATGAGGAGSSTHDAASSVVAIEPQLFRRIRAAFGIDEANLSASISLQPGRTVSNMTMIGGSEAAGKSGAFFFLSPDQARDRVDSLRGV